MSAYDSKRTSAKLGKENCAGRDPRGGQRVSLPLLTKLTRQQREAQIGRLTPHQSLMVDWRMQKFHCGLGLFPGTKISVSGFGFCWRERWPPRSSQLNEIGSRPTSLIGKRTAAVACRAAPNPT
jgi:hypothetical protein